MDTDIELEVAMSEEKSKKESFTARDRRFSSGEDRTSGNTEENFPGKEEPGAGLPEISFMTFIMSLNASAMVHLGIIEDPGTGSKTKSPALGKQTIDILGMLEEKTRGNLDKDEENMLKNILYDLRIIYVKETS
jgi:hypothetical protein